METKRIYPSTQLIVALDSRVLKLYLWILSWSAKGDVKYYPKQFAKACKLTEEEVDKCLQSLVDAKLITVTNYGEGWMLSVNAEQNQKYYQVPISKVLEGNGIPMAEKVTWNVVETKDDESDEELQRQILMLQARLNERQQVRKKVVTATSTNNVVDDLPF
jgi:hypothetical protein